MAVTITDIIVVMIAFAICMVLAALAKLHVMMHCQDNPEIIWIWLDDGNEPRGGCRVKNEAAEMRTRLRCSPVPCV